MPTSFDISLYVTKNGKTPFTDWLEKLRDKRGRYLIKTRLDRLEDGDLGDSKPVDKGIFELRVAYGQGIESISGKMKAMW